MKQTDPRVIKQAAAICRSVAKGPYAFAGSTEASSSQLSIPESPGCSRSLPRRSGDRRSGDSADRRKESAFFFQLPAMLVAEDEELPFSVNDRDRVGFWGDQCFPWRPALVPPPGVCGSPHGLPAALRLPRTNSGFLKQSDRPPTGPKLRFRAMPGMHQSGQAGGVSQRADGYPCLLLSGQRICGARFACRQGGDGKAVQHYLSKGEAAAEELTVTFPASRHTPPPSMPAEGSSEP